MSDFWKRFDELAAAAALTVDGSYILITGSDGSTHELEGESDFYLVGYYTADAEETGDYGEMKTATVLEGQRQIIAGTIAKALRQGAAS